MKSAKYCETFNFAFVATPDKVSKLFDVLKTRVGAVEITADCADYSREFSNLDELLKYENPPARQIKQLSLAARSEDLNRSASVVLANSRLTTVTIYLTSRREDGLLKLKNDILDIVDGLRPWYGFFSTFEYHYFLLQSAFLLCMVLYGGLTLLAFLGWLPKPGNGNAELRITAIAALVLSSPLMLALLTSIVVGWTKGFLAPRGVFAIGQGKSRFDLQEKIRWGVVIAFVVSIAAGLVITLAQLLF